MAIQTCMGQVHAFCARRQSSSAWAVDLRAQEVGRYGKPALLPGIYTLEVTFGHISADFATGRFLRQQIGSSRR